MSFQRDLNLKRGDAGALAANVRRAQTHVRWKPTHKDKVGLAARSFDLGRLSSHNFIPDIDTRLFPSRRLGSPRHGQSKCLYSALCTGPHTGGFPFGI